MALALDIFKNDADIFENLKELITAQEVGAIVIGVPEYREQGTANKAEDFAKNVQKRFSDIHVSLFNEMFTSKMATDLLRERERNDKADHAEAARIILGEWLEKTEGPLRKK